MKNLQFFNEDEEVTEDQMKEVLKAIQTLEMLIKKSTEGMPPIIVLNATLRCVAEIIETLPEEDRADATTQYCVAVLAYMAMKEQVTLQ